jgi:hypothetical protein
MKPPESGKQQMIAPLASLIEPPPEPVTSEGTKSVGTAELDQATEVLSPRKHIAVSSTNTFNIRHSEASEDYWVK